MLECINKLSQKQHEVLKQITITITKAKGKNSDSSTYVNFEVLDTIYTGEIKKEYFHQLLEEHNKKSTVFDFDTLVNTKINGEVRVQRRDILKDLEEYGFIKNHKIPRAIGWTEEYSITNLGWKYIDNNIDLSNIKRQVYLKGTDKQRKYGFIIRKELLHYIELATDEILKEHLEGWENNPDKINFDSNKIRQQMKYIEYATDMINSIPDAKFFIDNLYCLGRKNNLRKKGDTSERIIAIEECCNKYSNERHWKIIMRLCKHLRKRFHHQFR